MTAAELEKRLVAIEDVAIVKGKYAAGRLTPELRAEHQRLYSQWLAARAQMRMGDDD